MITIDYWPDQKLKVTGHADYASNNDPVCAGVSSIVLGAALIWQTIPHIVINQGESGAIMIDFSHCELNDQITWQIQLQFVVEQLKILVTHYHQFVQLRLH